MTPTLRSLLRHVALGTPLVLAPAALAGVPLVLGCSCRTYPEEVASEYAYTTTGDEETRTCESICEEMTGQAPTSCELRDGGVVLCSRTVMHSCGGAGRLPLARADRRVTTAGWLLETATLELAAVPAFEELAEALTAHGAPRSLVRRARRSATDEIRHARLLVSIAGPGTRAEVTTRRAAIPSLEALALHNAAEGCVREAVGAIEAAHQAAHAHDPALRSAMATIARDEARHALLSFDVDAWARTRLGASSHRRLDEARRGAASTLGGTGEAPELGLLAPEVRRRLASAA